MAGVGEVRGKWDRVGAGYRRLSRAGPWSGAMAPWGPITSRKNKQTSKGKWACTDPCASAGAPLHPDLRPGQGPRGGLAGRAMEPPPGWGREWLGPYFVRILPAVYGERGEGKGRSEKTTALPRQEARRAAGQQWLMRPELGWLCRG